MLTPPRPMLDQMFGLTVGEWLRHFHVHGTHASVTTVHQASSFSLVPVVALCLCCLAAGTWCALHARDHLSLRLRALVSPRVQWEMWRWSHAVPKTFRDPSISPKPIGGKATMSGTTLVLRFKLGGNVPELTKAVDSVSSAMGAPVQLEPVWLKPHRCIARIQRRDILAETFPWPWLDRETTDFFGPIPAAVDLDGNPVVMDLREKNVLVGGGMGSGKSWWLHTIVAAAMFDTRVRVHILDGKMGSGFAQWEDAADSFATNDSADLAKALKIVKSLEARANRIYGTFRSAKERTVDWSTVEVADLLVIDEFTAFLAVEGFQRALMNLLARFRAAGGIIILTTQRPSSQIMNTDLRELFQFRAAFASDPRGTTMILGETYREYDSSQFPNPGEMWLLAEGSKGRKMTHCRGYSLTDSDLSILAARAVALRSKTQPETSTVPNDQRQPDRQPEVDTPAGADVLKPQLALIPNKTSRPEPVLRDGQRWTHTGSTLLKVRELGPDVSGPQLLAALGIGSDVLSRCGAMLLEAGYVSRARRDAPGDRVKGNRVPWLWTITPAGKSALSAAGAPDEARKEAAQ